MFQTLVKERLCFEDTLENYDIDNCRRNIDTLQINVGKLCNQKCTHCHVNGGPDRKEIMDIDTINQILKLLSENPEIQTIDITGGAPELNPSFRFLINELYLMNKKIIVHSNLTVFYEDGQEDTPEFLAEKRVQISASLPCYIKENVNIQRGNFVFQKSIIALKKLNMIGYGKNDPDLILNLIYNPIGTNLPPEQSSLETEYKIHLKKLYDVEFNQLFTITNMPIQRYAQALIREGKYDFYINLLSNEFSSQAALNIMCRELISIGWDGEIYDCDFNQAMRIPLKKEPKTIWDIKKFNELDKEIAFLDHCFGCTAGFGSSCKGSLV